MGKYVSLSLNDKVKVIEAKEKDKLSVRDIMEQFKCRKTQIYDTLKNKDKIMEEWLQGNGQMKRKAKITGNEAINEIVWEWFTNARSKNMHISGPMIQSEALAVAKSLGNEQFKASTGWLASFKKRHNIVWDDICGHYSFESAADLVSVNYEEKSEEEEEVMVEEIEDNKLKILTHDEAIKNVMELIQFAVHSNSASMLESLYYVKDCIQKDIYKKSES